MRASRSALALCLGVGFAALYGCGSRTGLLVGEDLAASDAGTMLQPLTPPPPDARPAACADAGTTILYAITESNTLIAYDPPSNSFQFLGNITCPGGGMPFSMAVDQSGAPTTIFSDGTLYRLQIHSGGVTCQLAGKVPSDAGPNTFGMGYTANVQGGETLYIATNAVPSSLGILDTTTYTVRPVAEFQPDLASPELSGNGAGELFAFAGDQCSCNGDIQCCTSSKVVQVDKTNGRVLGAFSLKNLPFGRGWAFGYWGGALYLFTAPDNVSSVVTRFDLATHQAQQVQTYPEVIVGAGVSTCAPLDAP